MEDVILEYIRNEYLEEDDDDIDLDANTYTLTYANNGDADATGVIVADALPAGANYVRGGDSFDGTTVQWAGLDLGARSPEEIALAIMAEIVASQHGASPGWEEA